VENGNFRKKCAGTRPSDGPAVEPPILAHAASQESLRDGPGREYRAEKNIFQKRASAPSAVVE
jgi:hypothetical protein